VNGSVAASLSSSVFSSVFASSAAACRVEGFPLWDCDPARFVFGDIFTSAGVTL
jgi:hypothetical protein